MERGLSSRSAKKVDGKDLFFIVDENGEYHRADPETVGEYTGLTDSTGTGIFEGDILESFYKKKRIVSVVKYGGFEPEFFYECAAAQGFFLHGMKLYGLYAYDLTGSEMMFVEDMRQAKIIGNIYDNPELLDEIEAIPTIEAQPVKHGTWIRRPDDWFCPYSCSACGEKSDGRYKYCPECGAKMDGDGT